jgi:hypothetical protein
VHTTIEDDRRALVDLLPQVLRGWSRGWDGLGPSVAAIGLTPPEFFELRSLIQERDPGVGMTRTEMLRDFDNPYSTFRPILDHLPALVAAGYVARDGERYTVRDAGRKAFERAAAAREAYLATLAPIPADDLARLIAQLQEIAERLQAAPEPGAKPHQARSRRTPPSADAAPMVWLIHAIYSLWEARDDAHNAAWRAAGFDGPAFDLLSRVWSGEAATIPALMDSVRLSQTPEDVQRGTDQLVADGYASRDGDMLTLTAQGRAIRDAIERETDRIYFTPWPPLTAADVRWLRTTMAALVAGLPSS